MSTQNWTRFGTADLSNCEREQIHLAGSIQPHGALLVLDPHALTIRYASANADRYVGRAAPELLGVGLHDLSPATGPAIRVHDPGGLRVLPHRVPFAVQGHLEESEVVAHVHESPDGYLVLELEEPVERPLDRTAIGEGVRRLLGLGTEQELFDEAATLIRDATGYDRVMVYRFDEEGHGAIVAEEKEEALESFLGNHYPASDIPQIARTLYLRNRTRVLVDVDYEAVPVLDGDPVDPEALDMSLCRLRSMSPIHLQYLRNMGVGATLVASLVVRDELWGLIACHHYGPKRPGHAVQAMCELVAEVLSTRIVALESAARAAVDFFVRRFEQRMVESIGRSGEWIPALMDGETMLLESVDATGAALVHDGRIYTLGTVPSTADLERVAAWVGEQDFDYVFDTHRLGREEEFRSIDEHAAGVLAVRISRSSGELMLWFRPEQVRMVTWGGDPHKPVELDSDDPATLSPRRSFEAWHQLVEHTSKPWTPADRTAARAIGASITDVVLQFRSVRLLMAHRRIEVARGQIDGAEAPLLITDGGGRRILANEAFGELIAGAEVEEAEDLEHLFVDPSGLEDLLRPGDGPPRSWRGRLDLAVGRGRARPVLVRADPIFDAQEELIGTVFLFLDLSGKRELESARLRFQQAVVQRRSRFKEHLTHTDQVGQELFNGILENASVAALEAVGGMDVEEVPGVLRSIEISLTRASDLLRQLDEGDAPGGVG